jgi:hypothetical protein
MVAGAWQGQRPTLEDAVMDQSPPPVAPLSPHWAFVVP